MTPIILKLLNIRSISDANIVLTNFSFFVLKNTLRFKEFALKSTYNCIEAQPAHRVTAFQNPKFSSDSIS